MEHLLPPQLLEPRGIGGGVAHSVLNVPVPEIVLTKARVRALVSESKAAGMAQHVGMDGNGEAGLLAVFSQGQVDGRAVQGLTLLTEEERQSQLLAGCFQVRALHQPLLDGADLIPPQRVGGGEAPLEASVVEDAALDVHLRQHQAAGLRVPEPMTKHQQDYAMAADLVPTPFHSLQEPFKFSAGEVFSIIHTSAGSEKARSMSRAPCNTRTI